LTSAVTFHGKNSHAIAAPWDGYSALSRVIQTFNLIDTTRIHFRDGTRIHGIITEGGKAVNIIPQTAQAMFSVCAFRGAVAEARERENMAGSNQVGDSCEIGTGRDNESRLL
jgi:metal-dependent amidase/aminoacylase/carboxypeptidase family protein